MKQYIKNKIITLLYWKWNIQNIKKSNDKVYFFPGTGIGDTLYALIYMKAYKQKNKGKKVIFVVKKSHKALIDMYKEYVDDTILVNDFYLKVIKQYLLKHRNKENNIIFAHPYSVIKKPDDILGIKGISLLDLYKLALDLPNDTEYTKPNIIKSEEKNEIISLEKKNILICPYCVSTPMIEENVWCQIADVYTKQGYQVYTNIKDDSEKVVQGTKPISLNLEETYQLAEKFEHIYAIRSGLCDLLAFSDVKLTVLYPQDKKGKEESSTYKRFNFKNIGIKEEIEEIIVSEEFLSKL